MHKKINDKLTYCSFWMTIVIVIYHIAPHLIEIFDDSKHAMTYIKNLFDTFGPIALNYFFAVSAYKFFISPRNYRDKITRRITTLAIPFFVWNTLYIPLYIMQNGMPDLITYICGYSFNPFDGPLWYIFVLYIFFILSFRLDSRTLTKKTLYVTVIIALVAALFHRKIMEGNCSFPLDFWIERSIRMIPPFLFGAYCGKNLGILERVYNKKLYIIGFVFAVLSATLLGDGFITTLMLYFCTFSLWNATPILNLRKNSLLKQGVFLMYALHDGIIKVMLAVIKKSDLECLLSSGIFGFIGCLSAIVTLIWIISIFTSKIISYCPKSIDIMLTGNRNSFLRKE